MSTSADNELRSSIQALGKFNGKTYTGDCETKNFCPPLLKSLLKEDKENRFLNIVENRYGACLNETKQNKYSFYEKKELVNFYSSQEFPNMGNVYTAIINRCSLSNPEVDNQIVAKYFYYLARIQQGQISALDEKAAIDISLGKAPLSDVNCEDLKFQNSIEKCKQVKNSCKDLKSEQASVQEAEAEQERIAEINSQITKMSQKKEWLKDSIPYEKMQKEELNKQLGILNFEKEQILSRNPILKSESIYGRRGNDFKKAYLAQLKQNSNKLKDLIIQSNSKTNCFTAQSTTKDCNEDSFFNFVQDYTPEISLENKSAQPNEKKVSAQNFLKQQQCLHKGNFEKKELSALLWQSTFDAALTIATMGLATPVVAARALYTARGMRLLNASKQIVGFANASNFSVGVTKAIDRCSTEKVSSEKGFETKEMGQSCQLISPLATRSFVKKIDECVLLGAMAALGMAPMIAKSLQREVVSGKLTKLENILLREGVSKEELELERKALAMGAEAKVPKKLISSNAMLSDADRKKKIKQQFENLSVAQVNCVVEKVHTIGSGNSVARYTRMQIISKYKTAREVCNISKEDTEALLKLGFAGELPEQAFKEAAAEFANLLAKPTIPVVSAHSSGKLLHELETEEILKRVDDLKRRIAGEPDPLKKVEFRDEIDELIREATSRPTKDTGLKIDKTPVRLTSATDSSRSTTTALTLSSNARARIVSEGGSEFEALNHQIIPGKQYSFKSDTHGVGSGELLRLDDTMPGNVLLKSFGKDGGEKVISVPMEDLAITKKQIEAIQRSQAPTTKGGGSDFQSLLRGPTPGSAKQRGVEIADNLAKQAGRSPLDKEVDELKLSRTSILDDKGDRLAKLTTLSGEEQKYFKALYEIDTSKMKPTPEEFAVIQKAKEIRASKAQNRMSDPQARRYFEKIEEIENDLRQAPAKIRANVQRQLENINKRSDFKYLTVPPKTSFARALGKDSLTSYEAQDHTLIEKVLKLKPDFAYNQLEPKDMNTLAQVKSKLEKSASDDPAKEWFLSRLKLYLEYFEAIK
ncbi:MAG: hypothetical protein HUU56_13160 [Bdellovibrionaceae bacterium]|nr:hypothetical protein [Pseudobdellovibrionaceae bacterium]